MHEHYGQPDCVAEARKAEAELKVAGERTVLTTTYSASKNVAERKAELASSIPDGSSYPELLSPYTPSLGNQLRTLLARLYSYRPRIARFWMDSADHADMRPPNSANNPGFLERNCELPANKGNEPDAISPSPGK
jgi:hypothetical protein